MPKPPSNRMLSVVACPRDKGRLEPTNRGLHCTACRAEYPVVGGVPILIDEEASVFTADDFRQGRVTTLEHRDSLKNRLIRLGRAVIPPITAKLASSRNLRRFRELLGGAEPPFILVVGSGEMGRGMRPIAEDPDLTVISTDVYMSPTVNIIADAHSLPFPDESFDGVICQVVLEHVLDPVHCVAEIHRVLKPRGLVYAETPFMQHVHGGPFDFTRFTAGGHRRLFRWFKQIDAGINAGPGSMLAWSIIWFIGSFSRSRAWWFLRKTVFPFFVFWLKYFDYLLVRWPQASDGASEFYFLGVKAEAPVPDREMIQGHWSMHNSGP